MSANDTEEQSKYPPERLRGLMPYKSGQSGNPGGVKRGTVYPAEAYKRLGAMQVETLRGYSPRNAIEAGAKNTLLRAAEATDWKAAHAAMKEVSDRIEGKADRRITIEQVPELKTRIVTMVAALRMINENIHTRHCEPDKCACLDDEQFRAALLTPYTGEMRSLIEAELDEHG